MTKEIKGIIVSRLIILISIISIPIVIFLIYNLFSYSLWYSNDPILNFWVIKVLTPLVYSISWLYFLILTASRLANTLEMFNEKISVVPSRLKFFYGMNALYILLIFIFPIITPAVSVLSFMSFAWKLTTFRRENWDDSKKVPFLTKASMILFALLPIYCTISVIPQYLDLSLFLWNNIWIPILPYLFIVSYSLFTALSFGSLIILLSNSGISEYEQTLWDMPKKKRFIHVKIFEIILFLFLLYLDINRYLGIHDFKIVNLFYILGFIIIIFTSLVNYVKGKSKYKDFKGHLIGYFIAIVFIGSNVIFSTQEISEFLRVWSLIISAVIYIFVFFYTFITIE